MSSLSYSSGTRDHPNQVSLHEGFVDQVLISRLPIRAAASCNRLKAIALSSQAGDAARVQFADHRTQFLLLIPELRDLAAVVMRRDQLDIEAMRPPV